MNASVSQAIERGRAPFWLPLAASSMMLLMSCSTMSGEGSSSTTRPLGYPTTTLVTVPAAAPATEGDGPAASALPEELATLADLDWVSTGRLSEAPTNQLVVTDFGAVADDGVSDSAAFADAVQAAATNARNGTPTTIMVPPGRFLLTETLSLQSSTVLRGAGAGVTKIDIDLDGADAQGITMIGQPFGNGDWTPLIADADRGSRVLPTDAGFQIGQIIEIEQDNVDQMVTKEEWVVEWGEGSSGAILLIADTGSDEAVISHGLSDSFEVTRNARVRPISEIRRAGIEALTIERLDPGYGHTVAMRYGYDLWVRDVELRNTTRAHIGIDQVGRCEVGGSSIHGAQDYGDGGRAYGISVARHTTNCRIEDNALWDLRHAMIIQLGASGNVFGYNDARGSAGYEDRQPRADISIHGHWPQANLFEGNVVDRVVFADWWGPAGPYNVFWRGCALDSAIITESSNDQVVIASVIGPGGLTVDDTIDRSWLAANVVDNDNSGESDTFDVELGALPPSLYGSLKPAPSSQDCRVAASDRNPWAQVGADRP